MGLTDLFLMIMLITLIGAFIYFVSGLVNLFRKKQSSSEEFKRMLIFLGLTILLFILFGISL